MTALASHHSASGAAAPAGRRGPHRLRGGTAALALCVVGLGAGPAAHADDAPAFERPGIGFASSTLPAGSAAWEQGLPDISYDRSGGVRRREYVAASLLRIALAERMELQLGADGQVWQRERGAGIDRRGHGGGDASVGMKWALPSARDDVSWALLGTARLPAGRAPYGDAGHRYDLGVSAGWDLEGGRGAALYANLSDADEGRGWTVSPSYTFYAQGGLSAYAEAGIGGGEDEMRALGTGLTWLLGGRMQLDLSVLRGLSSRTPDWQGGLGVSFWFH